MRADLEVLGLVLAGAMVFATAYWMVQRCWDKRERRNQVIGSALPPRRPNMEDAQ